MPAVTGAVRRLPLVPTRCRGESFASWMDRLADDLRISRPEAWVATGLTDNTQQLPRAYGVTLDQTPSVNLAVSTGVTTPTTMLLRHYDAGAVEVHTLQSHRTAGLWGRSYWVFVGSSGACPECLNMSGGVWQLAWKVAWTFGCPIHQRYLTYGCPRCGSHWQSEAKDVRQRTMCCTHVGPSSPRWDGRTRVRSTFDDICGFRVADAPAEPIESAGNIELLHHVGLLLDPAADLRRPDGVTTRMAFDELLNIARLVLHIATPAAFPDDLDAAGQAAVAAHIEDRDATLPRRGEAALTGYRAYRHPPTSGPLLAAILRVAEPIVLSPNPAAHIEHLLGTALADHAGKLRWIQLQKHWKPPSRLAAPFRDAHQSAHYPRGVALDGRSRYSRASAQSPAASARHVPQLLWPDAHRWLLGDLACLQRGRELPQRRFTAMALAREIDPALTTWHRAAAALGLPAEYADIGKRLSSALSRDARGVEFGRRLAALHEALNNDPDLIEYALRRQALAGLVRIPGKRWEAVLRESGLTQQPASWRWPRHGAAWIWCEATCGDYHLAPALGLLWLTTRERRVEDQAFRQYFLPRHLPRMENELRQLASEVLASCQLPGDLVHDPGPVPA